MQVETYERFEEIASGWDDLADRVNAAPWLRPGWISRWWRAFGTGRLQILALLEDGRVTGVLPLYERRGALLAPTNWHTPEFGAVTESNDATELAIALLARRPRRIQLGWLDKKRAGFDECKRAAEEAGYRLIVRTLERSPCVKTDDGWDRYEARLSSKLLRELRRRRRGLETRGALTLDVRDGTQRLDELLDEGFRVEGAAWKAARGSAIDSQPATRSFYRDVAHWAAKRGSLRLGFLRLDETPLAFDYCLEESGIHYLVKTGYDPQYRASAPGQLMRYLMIQRAFGLGLDSYEFLGADEPWKLEWSQQARDRTLLQAFAPSPAGRLDWAAFAFGRPLVRRMYGALRR